MTLYNFVHICYTQHKVKGFAWLNKDCILEFIVINSHCASALDINAYALAVCA